jgi:glycosyltransferase involved in cell wall biosynthesis
VRILYTVNFHGDDGGGITTYILSLARAFAPRHAVAIAAPGQSRLYQTAKTIPGVEAIRLEFRNSLQSMIGTGLALRRLLATRDFDIVHVNGSADHRIVMFAALGKGHRRPRIVYTRHHDLPAKGLMAWLKASSATDAAICISDYMKGLLSATAYRKKPLPVVHHGVDLQWYLPFAAEAAREARQRWLPDAPAEVLAVGSIAGTGMYKGWLDMVAAAASLPADLRSQIRILIAGKMPGEAERRAVASLHMEGSVIYTGILRDVRPLVAALDVGFVLSCRETLSFACREMMAMGKPVIVSDIGGLPENVTPGVDGWIVPAGGKAEIAALLRGLLLDCAHQDHAHLDRAHLVRAGEAARARSEREFSLQAFAAGTETVYHQCVRRAHEQRSPSAASESPSRRLAQSAPYEMAAVAGERLSSSTHSPES